MAKADLETDIDEDEDLDEELDSEEEEEVDADADGEEDADADADDKPKSKTPARVRELQSIADKATARANALQKQIDASKGKKSSTDAGTGSGAVPPEIQQWLDVAQETARSRLYESDPRLKEYGIDPALINGNTPAEMQAAFKTLKQVVNRVESKARSKVLQEHGFAEPPKSSSVAPKRNYETMSDEDFQAIVRNAGR